MTLLAPDEIRFLDVFLHEATSAPFAGPATNALHMSGIEYGDISYIAWAYEQEVPRTSFAVGHAADVAPSIPWTDRLSALRRNEEIRRIWEQRQPGGEDAVVKSEGERNRELADEMGAQGHPGEQVSR
jgi:hypothetical protein